MEDTRRNQAQYGIRVLTAARGFGDHPETYRTVSVLPVLYTYIQGQLASYQLPGEWIRASAKMSSPPPSLLQTLPYTYVLFPSSLPVSLRDLLQCTRPPLLTGGGACMYGVYVSVIFLDSDCITAHSIMYARMLLEYMCICGVLWLRGWTRYGYAAMPVG